MSLIRPAAPILATAAALAIGAPWATHAADPSPQQSEAGIRHVVGGIGEDEQTAMREMAGDYNLHIVSSTLGGGYLADVRICIVDAAGARLLEADDAGPTLLADLAPARYQVVAMRDGQTQERDVSVPSTGSVRVNFRWADDEPEPDVVPTDGDPLRTEITIPPRQHDGD